METRTTIMKPDILKSLLYLQGLPPSKWDIAIITRFKVKVLDDLILLLKGSVPSPPSPDDILEKTAQKVFDM